MKGKVLVLSAVAVAMVAAGCAKSTKPPKAAPVTTPEVGPGAAATDKRAPEVPKLSILKQAKGTMLDGLAQAESKYGPAIEAKYELDDKGKLSLSIYPNKHIELDAERNEFDELAGDATVAPWSPEFTVFKDEEHLKRSARDLTLVQLSTVSLAAAVKQAQAAQPGFVYWAIPTIRDRRPGYGIYIASSDDKPHYMFVDGKSPNQSAVEALGKAGPGAAATDARKPELPDLSVLKQAKVTMLDGIAQGEQKYGPAIEAKFELDDQKRLSLSVYPNKHFDFDAERDEFDEFAGPATATPWNAEFQVFKDQEHMTRSARNLTLMQTLTLSLKDAIAKAQAQRQGVVFWAIPTMRAKQAGYGIYIAAPDNDSYYYFVS
jgi:hypothetical protein